MTYVLEKIGDVPKEQAEGPMTQDANTRGERNITHEAMAQGDGVSTAKPQGTPEEQAEVQGT